METLTRCSTRSKRRSSSRTRASRSAARAKLRTSATPASGDSTFSSASAGGIAKPEADEIELVPVAVGISDFGLDGPEEVACLSHRFQVARRLHAVTEQPLGRENLRFWDLIDYTPG